MNEIVYNNYDLVAFEQNGEVVVAVTLHSTGITRRKLRARLIIDGEPDARSWRIRS
jgi:hypothetical protein